MCVGYTHTVLLEVEKIFWKNHHLDWGGHTHTHIHAHKSAHTHSRVHTHIGKDTFSVIPQNRTHLYPFSLYHGVLMATVLPWMHNSIHSYTSQLTTISHLSPYMAMKS